jgi:CubicO group peptidase (beta-lactamase class C family)
VTDPARAGRTRSGIYLRAGQARRAVDLRLVRCSTKGTPGSPIDAHVPGAACTGRTMADRHGSTRLKRVTRVRTAVAAIGPAGDRERVAHSGAFRREHTAQLIEALGRYIPEVLRITRTPGLSAAFALPDGTVWEAAHGRADLTRDVPMTDETVGRAGSVSKLYTAVAVMQLVEDGVIDLYAPLKNHLPGLGVENPYGERDITVYDLLTHRSGLGTDTIHADLTAPPPLPEYIRAVCARGARPEYGGAGALWTAKVGEAYRYSNFGMAILGYLVEEVNGQGLSLSDYVDRHICMPLGMRATILPATRDSTHVPQRVLGNQSRGYAQFGDLFIPSPDLHSAVFPAAGLLTTAGDHLRLLLALLNGGQHQGARILSEDSVRFMRTPQVQVAYPDQTGSAQWWSGIGVEMQNLGSPTHHFGHGGCFPWGWWCDSRAYPALGAAVVVFTNKWDMTRWYNPPPRIAPGLLADFVCDWFTRADGRRGGRPTSWADASSYLAGVMMSERVHGLLGAREAFTRAHVDAMVSGAWSAEHAHWWSPERFRQGVEEIKAASAEPDAIRRFLGSGEGPVRPEELKLHALEFGRAGDLSVPMRFWAERMERGV